MSKNLERRLANLYKVGLSNQILTAKCTKSAMLTKPASIWQASENRE